MARSKSNKTVIEKPTKDGVPEGARFVNKTTFTNNLIKQASAQTMSSVLRVCYILFGVAMGVLVVVLRCLLIVDNLVTILVLLMGLMMVWQGYRLPLENARRIISQLGAPDDVRRTRTMFATNSVFGIVLDDNSTYTFPWDKFNGWDETPNCLTLSLTGQSLLIALDPHSFEKGSAQDFLDFLKKKITPKKESAFTQWTRRVCNKLDNWKTYRAQALKEENQRKAAKQEAKKARKAKKK